MDPESYVKIPKMQTRSKAIQKTWCQAEKKEEKKVKAKKALKKEPEYDYNLEEEKVP